MCELFKFWNNHFVWPLFIPTGAAQTFQGCPTSWVWTPYHTLALCSDSQPF